MRTAARTTTIIIEALQAHADWALKQHEAGVLDPTPIASAALFNAMVGRGLIDSRYVTAGMLATVLKTRAAGWKHSSVKKRMWVPAWLAEELPTPAPTESKQFLLLRVKELEVRMTQLEERVKSLRVWP